MRTVEIVCIHPERFENFRAGRDDKVKAAIGYLSSWAMTSYNRCQLSIQMGKADDDVEFVAFYQQMGEDGKQLRKYVIGGIWHEATREFSFHS